MSWTNIAWVTARQTELEPSGRFLRPNAPALSVEGLLERLFELLLPDRPRPLSFEDDAARRMLQDKLRATKHFIVIDNLETISDVASLMPSLHSWCGPTKFVLTSRESYFDERNIHHYPVPELSAADALALIRMEAEISYLPQAAAATDEQLYPIYETVGGNPLALRLVAGQLHSYGLNDILGNLKQGLGRNAENLYTHIYRHAWDRLGEVERHALLSLVLVAETGSTLDEIKAFSDIDDRQLHRALGRLVRLNLVDCRGSLTDRRYSLHNLTRSFLHRQVIDWQ